LTPTVSEVARSAEEAAKEVEGVVLLGTTATPLVLLDAIVAILVVYAAHLFVNENLVRFGYRDELVVCGFVSSACC
jgi:hypothetical protein